MSEVSTTDNPLPEPYRTDENGNKFVRVEGSPFIEVPDDWKPDAATIEFVAQLVTKEISRRSGQYGLLARGSDRHEAKGALMVLQSLAMGLVDMRNQIQKGTFGQTKEETECETTKS